MSSEARPGDKVHQKSAREAQLPAAKVVKERANFYTLEHYLYGKNVVRPIDMQNIRKQRNADESGIERNNNRTSSDSKGWVQNIYVS